MPFRRQRRIAGFAAAVVSIPGLVACDPTPEFTVKTGTSNHDNIIVFYVDDLEDGDVGSYGAVGVEKPHIDRLAANGECFADAHSTSDRGRSRNQPRK